MQSYDVLEFGQALGAVERQTPDPTGTEVLLRVSAAGICHSDLHIWKGYQELGGGRRIDYASRGLKLPLTLGHETVGEVIAVGPEAAGVRVGDIALVYAAVGCEDCAMCAAGNQQLCPRPGSFGMFRPGGYSDHLVVPHPRYLFDIKGLDPEAAAPLACAGLTAYGALKKVGSAIKEGPIVIFGAGGLGRACLTLLQALGGQAIVVDIDADKRDAATAAGAIAAVDAGAADVATQIMAVAGGSVPATIDFVGVSRTVQTALEVLRKGGRAVIVGLIGGEITLPIPMLVSRALTVQASLMGSLDEQRELIDFVIEHNLKLMPTQSRPLSTVNNALEELEDGRVMGRIILRPDSACCDHVN